MNYIRSSHVQIGKCASPKNNGYQYSILIHNHCTDDKYYTAPVSVKQHSYYRDAN